MDSPSRQSEQAAELLSEIAEAEREQLADISLIPDEYYQELEAQFRDAIENAGVDKGLSSLVDEHQSPQPHSHLQDLDLPASVDVRQRSEMIDGIHSQLDVLEENRRLSEKNNNLQMVANQRQRETNHILQQQRSTAAVSIITSIITGLWHLSGGVHQIGAVRITTLHLALVGLGLISIFALVAYSQNR